MLEKFTLTDLPRCVADAGDVSARGPTQSRIGATRGAARHRPMLVAPAPRKRCGGYKTTSRWVYPPGYQLIPAPTPIVLSDPEAAPPTEILARLWLKAR